jgi:hypothetical protein
LTAMKFPVWSKAISANQGDAGRCRRTRRMRPVLL